MNSLGQSNSIEQNSENMEKDKDKDKEKEKEKKNVEEPKKIQMK